MRIVKKYGYIDIRDGFIKRFIIHKKYRGKGYARQLSKFIPKHARLFPCRLFFNEGLSNQQLMVFYSSIGFVLQKDGTMVR
jgi:GNAT superfamily N-acetyltransferase